MSSNTLQTQFAIGSDRSVESESPQEDLNFSTPPLLLPSDLLASSPATNDAFANQAYLEAYKLLAKSPFAGQTKKKKQKPKKKDISDEPGPSSNVPELLSNIFSMAKNTGGILKAKDIEENTEIKPIFHAEIEETITDEKTVDKYALSSTESVESDQKNYETVYDNEQRSILIF